MRNIIEMLCDIPEDDWYTKRDPSSKESYKDASLRKFYTSGVSKKLARKMLGRLTENNFIDSIDDTDRSDVIREGLAQSIAPFVDVEVDSTNVATVLFQLFKKALECIINPEMENDRKLKTAQTNSERVKGTFGSGLLDDCENNCSMPGCSHHLQTLASNGKSINNYEIIAINDKKSLVYPNIIAVCHDCFQKWISEHPASKKKDLSKIKKLQMATRSIRTTLSEVDIDNGIAAVVESLMSLKPDKIEELNYATVPIENKIDKNANPFLASTIKDYVTRYYLPVQQIMQHLSKENRYSDEYVRAGIKESYKRLTKQGYTQAIIYGELSQRIQNITKQNLLYCYIVVSYFIQSCEVFDVIAK
jgi:hypothetical protein